MVSNKAKKTIIKINFILFFVWLFTTFFGRITSFTFIGKNLSLSFCVSFIVFPLFIFSFFFIYKKEISFQILIKYFLFYLLLLAVSSLGMAIWQFSSFGNSYNTNALFVWAKEIIKYCYDLFGIFYCCFFISKINKKNITYFIVATWFVWILVSFLQILVYFTENNILIKLYDHINFLGLLEKSSLMFHLKAHGVPFRFYGFCREPASNLILMIYIFLPFLLFKALFFYKNKKNIWLAIFYSLAFLITSLLALFTKSSTIIIGIMSLLISYFILKIFLSKKKKSTKRILLLVFLLGIGLAFAFFLLIPSIKSAFLKIFDLTNYSTQHRYSTIYNDLIVFLHFPLFGCGDGLQGYWYVDNIINSPFANNPETQNALKGLMGLVGGGAIVPSFISGFGIFGVILTIILIRKFLKLSYFSNIKIINTTLYCLIISIIISLAISWTASGTLHFVGSSYFILSLPYLRFCYEDNNFHVFNGNEYAKFSFISI